MLYEVPLTLAERDSDILIKACTQKSLGHLYKPDLVLIMGSDTRSMFLSKNNKKNVYPCKPQFYYMYIKVGCKGV